MMCSELFNTVNRGAVRTLEAVDSYFLNEGNTFLEPEEQFSHGRKVVERGMKAIRFKRLSK